MRDVTSWHRLFALAISTIFSLPQSVHADTAQPVQLLTHQTDTRVFMTNDCVFSVPDTERSAILSALAGSAIKVGMNRLGAALRAAGSEKTFTTIRSTNVDFNPARPPACIYIVQGDFLTDGITESRRVAALPERAPECNLPWATSLAAEAAKLRATEEYCTIRRLVNNGIFLSGAPDFFFEGRVATSTDKSAMTIEASVLHIASHLDRSLARDGGTLVLSFAIGEPGSGAPGADSLSSIASVTQLPFGKLRAPTTMFFTGRSGPSAPWLSLGEAEEGRPPLPRVVWAARSETRDAREFLLFLADVFDDSKENITSELQQTLVSSERRKAEIAQLTERATATTEAEKKWAEAEVALGEYSDFIQQQPSLQKRKEKAVAVRALQREANVLAKTAGRMPFYDKLLEIPTA